MKNKWQNYGVTLLLMLIALGALLGIRSSEMSNELRITLRYSIFILLFIWFGYQFIRQMKLTQKK